MDYDPETSFREVLREEGVLLDLTIRPAHTASFSWGTVNIPPQEVAMGREFFTAQVKHEVGHRVVPYAPSTVERGMAAREVAEREGIHDVHSFLNVIYDLMVDGRNLAKDPDVYRPYMEYYTKMYLSSPDPRMRLLGEMGNLLLGRKSRTKTAKRLYDLLYRDGRRFYVRLSEAARLLKHLFTGSEEHQYGSYGADPRPQEAGDPQDADGDQQSGQGKDREEQNDGSGGVAGESEEDSQEGTSGGAQEENTDEDSGKGSADTGKDNQDGKGSKQTRPTLANLTGAVEIPEIDLAREIDLVELARELQEAGVEVDPRGTGRRRQLFLTQQRLKLLDKFVEVTEKMGNRASSSEVPEVWRVGDDLTRLDLVDTIQRHGIAIPGVTTLKKGEGDLSGQGRAGAIMLLLDNSGSTGTAPPGSNRKIIDTIREAAFCLTETARRNGDLIGAVAFGDGIHWTRPMTNTDYEPQVDQLIEMEGRSSDTQLTGAVSWALDQIRDRPHRVTTFLITDGAVYDLDKVKPGLEELHSRGRVVIFLIKPPGQPPANMDEYTNKGFTVYQIDAGTEFSEEALVELDKGE